MHSQATVQTGFSKQIAGRTARTESPASSHLLTGAIQLTGTSILFARNTEIYEENEPANHLYQVISGTVRTYKVLIDGRRQIGAFYLPGDVLGLEVGEVHSFSAETMTETKMMVIKRSTVFALAARDSAVACQLLTLTGCELRRVQKHVMLLVKTAQGRVAGFLLEMAKRVPTGNENEVELPMSRQDIADYLGLTIETVSRTLTQLENSASIVMPTSRRIVLRNRVALRQLNA